MKKIAVLVVLAAAGLLAYNYATTGKITLLPASLSEEEREVQELEADLHAAVEQAAQAQRGAAVSGVDMTGDLEAARRCVRQVERSLDELKKRLSSTEGKRAAERLSTAIREFERSFS